MKQSRICLNVLNKISETFICKERKRGIYPKHLLLTPFQSFWKREIGLRNFGVFGGFQPQSWRKVMILSFSGILRAFSYFLISSFLTPPPGRRVSVFAHVYRVYGNISEFLLQIFINGRKL